MKADLYPFLTEIERDLDNPFSQPKGPWWGIGKRERDRLIHDTINKFDNKLKDAPAYELDVYAEGLKSHIARALYFNMEAPLSDYEIIIIFCHQNLTFTFLALIVRAYYIKERPFNVSDYAKNAGISDTISLFSAVSKAANDWAINFEPSIGELLEGMATLKRTRKSEQKEYDLLADMPDAKVFLERAQKAGYLNDDYSIADKTSYVDASIIAYTIADELKLPAKCKYFNKLWNIDDKLKLSDAHRQAMLRKNKSRTREVLSVILRKSIEGMSGNIEDSDRINKYMKRY